jgi:hypothetical protein
MANYGSSSNHHPGDLGSRDGATSAVIARSPLPTTGTVTGGNLTDYVPVGVTE